MRWRGWDLGIYAPLLNLGGYLPNFWETWIKK